LLLECGYFYGFNIVQVKLMEKIIQLLKTLASGRIVAGLFILTQAIYLTMLLVTLPAVQSFAADKVLFDLSLTGYSYDYAVSLLQALESEGRRVYLERQLPLDFIYPALFAISNALLLTWIFNKSYAPDSRMFNFCLIPFVAGLFDYLENIAIIQMIHAYPQVSPGLVSLSSAFTLLKSGFTSMFFLLLLIGLYRAIKTIFRPLKS